MSAVETWMLIAAAVAFVGAACALLAALTPRLADLGKVWPITVCAAVGCIASGMIVAFP